MHAPGLHTGFGDDDASGLGHGDEMFKDERVSPGHGFGRIADGAIFVAVGIFHQNRADAVGAQLRAERAVILPETFIVMADLRPVMVDGAALALKAMFAELARGFANSSISSTLQQRLHSAQAFPGIVIILSGLAVGGRSRIGFRASSTALFRAQAQR